MQNGCCIANLFTYQDENGSICAILCEARFSMGIKLKEQSNKAVAESKANRMLIYDQLIFLILYYFELPPRVCPRFLLSRPRERQLLPLGYPLESEIIGQVPEILISPSLNLLSRSKLSFCL